MFLFDEMFRCFYALPPVALPALCVFTDENLTYGGNNRHFMHSSAVVAAPSPGV
jgi:hypothetical protein